MFSVSPRGKNAVTQGKDLTLYEEITPQLNTRAKQLQIRQTLAGCGGFQVSQFGVTVATVLPPIWWLSWQSIPGQMGWHRLTAVPQQPVGCCATEEMNTISPTERLRECSDAPLPLGEPLLQWQAGAGAQRPLFKSPCFRFSHARLHVTNEVCVQYKLPWRNSHTKGKKQHPY